MKTKYIIKSILLAGLFTCTTSCADWLNVEMEDSIMEKSLFSTNEGFLTALNGVYTSMNDTYANTLSMGTIDIMAQYYTVRGSAEHTFYVFGDYKYSEATFESTLGTVWTKLYNLIANTNLLLEHCDEPDASIQAKYYPIVKGEALALRAMMHFDMLRLYGPIYSPSSEETLVMPYQETSSKDIQPLLSSKVVLSKVIDDLKAASSLLKSVDPICTDGILNSSVDGNDDNSLRFRQFRLNYYAIQLLLARAYLWGGDKATAYTVAHNILTETKADGEKPIFNWTKKEDVIKEKYPDRMFSPEVIFSLYNMKRISLYKSLFNPSVKLASRLTFVGQSIAGTTSKVQTFYDDENDVRRTMWDSEISEEETGAEGSLYFKKYADFEDEGKTIPYRYMIPLMRMSEVYLIAAECTSDVAEAQGYINKIRNNRSCANVEVTLENVQNIITKEFSREVIGEGQLFFYYKRHAMEKIPSGTKADEDFSINLSNYIWPLPKVETDKRF